MTTMKEFEQIEKAFLELEESNDSSTIEFYNENKSFLESVNLNDKEIGQKTLWMLSETVSSAYKLKDLKLARTLVKPTIEKFKEYSLKHEYDLKSDTFYKALIYEIAMDNFNNKRNFIARKYFKECVSFEKDNFRILDFYNESNFRFIKKTGRILGTIGIALYVLKDLLKWTLEINGLTIGLMGLTVAILLITFGITEFIIKKSPATNSC